MNSLGNRQIKNNVRILLINNSLGAEFILFKQLNSTHVNDTEKYIAAEGHFGHQSPDLVKHYATDLGFEYMSAWNEEEFEKCYERFVTPELTDKPMVFEVFTSPDDENEALKRMWSIIPEEKSSADAAKSAAKSAVKKVLGKETVDKVKEIVKILKK